MQVKARSERTRGSGGDNPTDSSGGKSDGDGGQGQQGGKPGGKQIDSKPVDDSGADDGEAFERIIDHLDDQQGQGKQEPAAQQDHPADGSKQGAAAEGQGADTTGGDLKQDKPTDPKEPGWSKTKANRPAANRAPPRGTPAPAAPKAIPRVRRPAMNA